MSNHSWGGARPGSGRLRQRLFLDIESARELAIVLKHRQTLQPDLTEERIVEEWIHRAWKELDEMYQQAAQEAS